MGFIRFRRRIAKRTEPFSDKLEYSYRGCRLQLGSLGKHSVHWGWNGSLDYEQKLNSNLKIFWPFGNLETLHMRDITWDKEAFAG
jgi:hypothetical protein